MNQSSSDKLPVDAAQLEERIGEPTKDGLLGPDDVRIADASSLHSGEDILALQDLDPVLNMKMHLVNNVSGNGQCA